MGRQTGEKSGVRHGILTGAMDSIGLVEGTVVAFFPFLEAKGLVMSWQSVLL
jgi:hypothetical protein